MTSISDERLFESSSRVKDRVVLITGAANGIGRQAALVFASYGAKVVIGDRDISGARAVVSEITDKGGNAFASPCDVTVWDDVVALYERAIEEYGTVDVVVANAGVTERGQFHIVKLENGKPVKPDLATLNVNLFGLINTVHLAQHYLTLRSGALKSIVILGSMASWTGIPGAAMYTASKHAALGIMRSLHPNLESRGIRIGILHPFFADTAIVPPYVKLLLAGIPMTPIERIAGTIFFIATDTGTETNGCAFMLPDDGPVFMIPKEEFKMGVYQMIDERRNRLLRGVKGLAYVACWTRDVARVLRKPVFLVVVAALFTSAWKYRNHFW